jgi:hypothetical protein
MITVRDRDHSGGNSCVRKSLRRRETPPENNRRLIMSVQLTNEIRELTAPELDAVSGGLTTDFEYSMHPALAAIGGAVLVGTLITIGGWIASLFD